jgi:hypothetical protein
MKKTFLGFAFAALAMLATSCSSEIDAPTATDGDVTVSFTAQLPGQLASRSNYSDGTTAKKLHYAVYAAGTNDVIFSSEDGDLTMDENKSATVNLNLVNGRSYDVVFWAYATDAPYSYNDASKQVTIDAAKLKCNDETLDAFYAVKTFTVTGPVTESIELTRPFAQINIGTNDIEEAKAATVTVENTQMKVKGYTAFNVMDGSVDGEETLTYAMTAIPSGETFPYQVKDAKTYEYLAMAYVLVPAEKQTVDVTMTVDSATNFEKTYSNIPVQRNYRTNIYGSLFTSPINYNVVINPAYNEPDYNLEQVAYVASASEFVDAMNKFGSPYIVVNEDFNLTTLKGFIYSADALDAVVDLNGHTLTYTNASMTLIPGNKKIVFKNGTIKMTGEGNVSSLLVYNGSSLTLQNVTLDAPNVRYPISCQGEGSTLTIEDSQINARTFCVSSDATVKSDGTLTYGQDATIVLKNSTFNATQTGFMNNVPANITMTNCKFYGNHQGALLRGGTYTIDGCYFILNATLPDTDSECMNNTTWGSGNRAAYAGLVLGNRSTGSPYQYPTTVTFDNNKSYFATTGDYASSFYGLYAYANAGEGLGVYITQNASLGFVNGCTYNIKASSNIWLNNKETAPATADE